MNITIPTIAAVSAALILAPSARAPSPKAEAYFIEDLDMLGLNPCTMRLPGGLEEEVKIGHAICTDLLNEADPYQELAALVKDVPALTQQGCRFPLEVAARMALTWVAPDRSVFSLAFVSH